MKRFLPVLFFSTIALASCSLPYGLAESGDTENVSSEKCVVKVQIDASDSRFIAPEALTWTSVDKIVFSYSKSETPVRTWESTEEKTAYELSQEDEILLDAESTAVTFRVDLYEDSNVVAWAEKSSKIQEGTNTIDFKTQYNTAEGTKGDLNVNLTFDGDDAGVVKAGLMTYASVTTAAEGYDLEELTVTDGKAEYSKTDVPAGYYFLKVVVYSALKPSEIIKNYIELVRIENGRTASGDTTISNFNSYYSVSYVLGDDAAWKDSYNPESVRYLYNSYTLPSNTNIDYAGYKAHWYDNAEFTGEEYKSIPSGTKGDMTFYAKWEEGYYLASELSSDVVKALYDEAGDDKSFTIKFMDVTKSTIDGVFAYVSQFEGSKLNDEDVKPSITLDFSECHSLYQFVVTGTNRYVTSIKLSDSLTKIPCSSIENCLGLKTVEISDDSTSFSTSDDHTMLFNKAKTKFVKLISGEGEITLPDTVTELGEYSFYNNSGITAVNAPCVKTLNNYVFQNCTALESVSISDELTKIPMRAFFNCKKLDFDIPSSVTSIGSGAFQDCTSLNKISLPESLTSIDVYAFAGCSGFTGTVTIPSGVTTVGASAFNGCGMTGVVVSSGVTELDSQVFCDCESLSSVTLPDTLTSIGSSAFQGCDALESITIPSSVTEIESDVFYECTGLKTVTINEGTSLKISYCAFNRCSSLETVTLNGDLKLYMKSTETDSTEEEITEETDLAACLKADMYNIYSKSDEE